MVKNLNVGGTASVAGVTNLNDTTQSTSIITGSLVTAGGIGLAKNLTVGGTAKVLDTTQATSQTTGSLTTAGGAGIAKDLFVGGNIYQAMYLLLPPGVVLPYATSSAPNGYLLCDGSAYSRATYAVLFAIIATTYGSGDGTTTFNIPDMRGRLPIGTSGSFALASTGGSANKTLTNTELPSHTHTGTADSAGAHTHGVSDPGHSHNELNGYDDHNNSNQPGQAASGDGTDNIVTGYATTTDTTGISVLSGGAHTHTFTTAATGTGSAFSLLNPYLSLSYIIKY